ncbi:hypothetical protein CVT26_003274 [Gymnopilus dilepis]|uniref:NAD-dependent epimerase/dehydratase domain-containing protein n=1 Tax=Gymnopilus dilepis TaxID=231916 RepID=A0A409Y4Y8_9AGAR|nr:hypothetical protein CVT26_003274 [Gymnopilus dilepis]
MPTISKGDKVLVSGADGYIAMWATRFLLERGYSVRGTVRNQPQAKFLEGFFSALGYGHRLEVVIIQDICTEGAFDEAVKGVDAIAHIAAPFHTNYLHDEIFKSAFQGMVGVLKSALINGTRIKRIVVTSSCAAVMSPNEKATTFNEDDWDIAAAREVMEKGSKAPPMQIFRASKTLAEKGAWKIWEKHKSEVPWELTTIVPPFVFGPPMHDVTSVKTLNASLQLWYDAVIADIPRTKKSLSVSNSWVDVRDVALAHVLALEKKEAGGERIITTAGGFNWQEWLSAAYSLPLSVFPSHKLSPGFPEILDGPRNYHITYDKSKEERILGIKFRTILETTRDTLEEFTRRAGAKILVSGVNGFLAMWIVRILLERGYSVRGTVRSESKGKYVKEYFNGRGLGEKLELVVVDDITKDGAFDEAVKGVDGIIHTASPFSPTVETAEVRGTVGILESARKEGQQVRRIMITSSCAAILDILPEPKQFSENDWADKVLKEVEELGAKDDTTARVYRASKTLAEKAAWDYYRTHKDEVQWDISAINPPYVFGPPIHEVSTPGSLNISVLSWYQAVVDPEPKPKQFLASLSSWADVRDVALAHVLALEKPDAGGERIIVSAGGFIFQEWLDIANTLSPSPLPSHILPRGIPEITQGEKPPYHITYDASKHERILGIKYHTKLETTRDTLAEFASRGW